MPLPEIPTAVVEEPEEVEAQHVDAVVQVEVQKEPGGVEGKTRTKGEKRRRDTVLCEWFVDLRCGDTDPYYRSSTRGELQP